MNTKARVSAVLERVVGLSASEAETIMLKAHTTGAALVATLPKAAAEALVAKVYLHFLPQSPFSRPPLSHHLESNALFFFSSQAFCHRQTLKCL